MRHIAFCASIAREEGCARATWRKRVALKAKQQRINNKP